MNFLPCYIAFYPVGSMIHGDLAEFSEDIQTAIAKLLSWEKRYNKQEVVLSDLLEKDSPDVLDVNFRKTALDNCYKCYMKQADQCQNLAGEGVGDKFDTLFDELIELAQKVSHKYGTISTKFNNVVALLTNPASDTARGARLDKYTKARDDLLSQIDAKKTAMANAKKMALEKEQLDRTELKEIEEQFNKLSLNSNPVFNQIKPPDVPSTSTAPPTHQNPTTFSSPTPKPSASLNPLSEEFHLFDYNADVDLANISNIHQSANDVNLNKFLIEKAMLPELKVETFSGDPMQYRSFLSNFYHTVMQVTSDPATQLSHLVSRCKGVANKIIKNKVISNDPHTALNAALVALDREFGQKEALIRSARSALQKSGQVDGTHDSLLQLSCDMENLKDVMIANKSLYELNSPSITSMIFKKFTPSMRMAFETQQKSRLLSDPSLQPNIKFDTLLDFVRTESRYSHSTFAFLTRDKSKSGPKFQQNANKNNRVYYADNSKEQSETHNVYKCRYCNSTEHSFNFCTEFRALPETERWKYFKEKGLCFVCSKVHMAKECKSKYRCSKCKMRHHINLPCSDRRSRNNSNRNNQSNDASNKNITTIQHCNNTASDTARFEFVYVPVLPAVARVGNKTVKVNVFLDGGSTITTASMRVKNALTPSTKPEKMTISGFHQKKVSMTGCSFSMFIKGIGPEFQQEVYIDKVYCLDNLQMPEFPECFPTKNDISEHPFLKDVPFIESDNTVIDILIGRNVPMVHRIIDEKHAPDIDTIHACKSVLGWYLDGPSHRTVLRHQLKDNSVTYVYCAVNEKVHNGDALDRHFRRMEYFDFDDPCYSMKFGRSRDDVKAQKMVEESMKKVDGMYSVGLPWRDDFNGMPCNRLQAEKRLLGLIPQFKKNPNFYKQYAEKMHTNITLHAEKITPDIEEKSVVGHVNYIPHFGIISADKFRVVNDAAAKSSDGKSLNDRMYSGEDIFTSLVSVLLRSRQHRYMFICDIASMFLSVGVNEKDRDALRFLWFKNGDYNSTIEDNRWKKWCFGLNSAPYATTKALRKTAVDNVALVSAEVVKIVFKNTYMDDTMKSCRTVKQCNDLAKAFIDLCETGNFVVAKFRANYPDILEGIDSEKLVPEAQLNQIFSDFDGDNFSGENTGKVLGMHQDFLTNEYFFVIKTEASVSTRRGVLRYYMKIFDPLGLMNIFVLCVKHILQEAVILNLQWDEKFPPDLERRWLKWLEHLNNLESIRIPICIKPSDDYVSIQLHIMVDASKIGYGSVAYVRVDYKTHIRFTLVASKGRICPRKKLSIVKLELQAAVVGVRLKNKILESFDEIEFSKVILWSDSKSVLQMLKNESKRFQIWFSYRIEEIHESTTLDMWRYCPTKLNSADLISRGVMPSDLEKSKVFFDGPNFLYLPEEQWPTSDSVESDDNANLISHLYSSATVIDTENIANINNLVTHYSCLWKLKRAVAYIIRITKYLLKPLPQREASFLKGRLLFFEIVEAEKLIIRIVQLTAFPNLFNQLENHVSFENAISGKTALSKDCCELKKLHPIKVDGIIRVGGRLRNSPLSDEIKHPILLPKDSNFTKLIIDFYHESNGHMGAHGCLYSIRERFWIINGLSTVKRRLRECMNCKIAKREPCKQIISSLPECRVTPNRPIFFCTSCDLCGPFFVKIGRSRVKRWICLFTCAATRACHIEVVHSLDTDSFLKALMRFMCIRNSRPQQIISDCGSNFVSADREIRKFMLKDLSHDKVEDTLAKKGVIWSFNPPTSSHRGGLVERMFRIFRSCFTSITQDIVLNDEDFLTVTCQISSIINHRPITKVSDDPNDFRALSPSQLMGGSIDASLAPSEFLNPIGFRKSLKNIQVVVDNWWKRWVKEYLTTLQLRQKWLKPARNLEIGDLVIIVDDNLRRNSWKMAIVTKHFPDSLGVVRTVEVRTSNGSRFVRDCRKLVLLEGTT